VNATRDPHGNVFVVFGTGRLWSQEDIRPCASRPRDRACAENHEQYIFGIKEELGPDGFPTYSDRTKDKGSLINVSGATVFKDGSVTGLPASKMLPTGPGGTAAYGALKEAIASPGALGYKRRLETGKTLFPGERHAYEMVLTQPKLYSPVRGRSLAAFTSYEPTAVSCGGLGRGYLHLVDAFTGLPEPSTHDYFYAGDQPPAKGVSKDAVIGAIAMGEGNPTEAVVRVSSGGVSISATDSAAGNYGIQIPVGQFDQGGLVSWKEATDTGMELTPGAMSRGLAGAGRRR
jgi:hypothetical protein